MATRKSLTLQAINQTKTTQEEPIDTIEDKPTEKLKRLTIDLSPSLHRQLKKKAVMEDTTMVNLVRKWVQDNLE